MKSGSTMLGTEIEDSSPRQSLLVGQVDLSPMVSRPTLMMSSSLLDDSVPEESLPLSFDSSRLLSRGPSV